MACPPLASCVGISRRIMTRPSQSRGVESEKLLRRLAANTRALRRICGMTQEELAHSASLAPRHLQKIEAGQVNVTLRTIAALASALDCQPAQLLEEDLGAKLKKE